MLSASTFFQFSKLYKPKIHPYFRLDGLKKLIYHRKMRSTTTKNIIKMAVYDTPAQEFNDKLAETLKGMSEFKMPEWALFVKTGKQKIKPPVSNDWWYNRAASILRQIYIKGIVGVNRLKVRYGGKKNRGMKPEIFVKGSGKIIRVILQQAETAGLLEKSEDAKKGRKMTDKGKKLLDSIKSDSKKE